MESGGNTMNLEFNQPTSAMRRLLKRVAAAMGLSAIVVTGMLITSSRGSANGNDAALDEQLKIQIGYQVNPVFLYTGGKDYDLLGLGSYIVNVVGDCNGCHSAGPATEFIGNPALFAPPSAPDQTGQSGHLPGRRPGFWWLSNPYQPSAHFQPQLDAKQHRNGGRRPLIL
jgi:hypothetical protein